MENRNVPFYPHMFIDAGIHKNNETFQSDNFHWNNDSVTIFPMYVYININYKPGLLLESKQRVFFTFAYAGTIGEKEPSK